MFCSKTNEQEKIKTLKLNETKFTEKLKGIKQVKKSWEMISKQ